MAVEPVARIIDKRNFVPDRSEPRTRTAITLRPFMLADGSGVIVRRNVRILLSESEFLFYASSGLVAAVESPPEPEPEPAKEEIEAAALAEQATEKARIEQSAEFERLKMKAKKARR